jgi:cytochrome c oxidase subunit 3
MLFFTFFWAYFHNALNPTYLIWPPIGIEVINPWSIPLFNTFLLLFSGILATIGHHEFLKHKYENSLLFLFLGILLGYLFFILQILEYIFTTYDITDSTYGSAFFLLTGFHGFHVIIGIIFLIITWLRIFNFHITNILFDLALLYYHLVDLIWIFLFILIYFLSF